MFACLANLHRVKQSEVSFHACTFYLPFFVRQRHSNFKLQDSLVLQGDVKASCDPKAQAFNVNFDYFFRLTNPYRQGGTLVQTRCGVWARTVLTIHPDVLPRFSLDDWIQDDQCKDLILAQTICRHRQVTRPRRGGKDLFVALDDDGSAWGGGRRRRRDREMCHHNDSAVG
ncbi:hypothetical protein ARMSODRAFT_351410 [Armillaria solidipes]|uniref:Uncharacterized protein n=1 Tax=Armillaria solidipes TaxID=1076256 RepID=A0A2H3BHP1_9AGAR|nr:hypothetical protein ARMSODRAFT_351410 [Armillaria solidipes]